MAEQFNHCLQEHAESIAIDNLTSDHNCQEVVPQCLVDVLRALENHVRVDESCKNIVNVTCFDVLEGGFRAFTCNTFRSDRKLSVRFAGELAIDDGGPTREFLRLSLKEIAFSRLFYGDNGKFLTLYMDGE